MTFHALAARYGADSLFEKVPGLKLATAVVDRNETFADNVWKMGHTMAFSKEPAIFGEEHEENEDYDVEISLTQDGEDYNVGAENFDEQSYQIRHTQPEPELEDILHDDRQVPMPKSDGIIPWLEDVYKSSRGFELGTFDASLLPVIWKKQSANWDDFALGYVSDVVSLVHKFIFALISAICDDERVRSALMSMLMDGLIDRYTKSIEHAKFIITVEKDGTPLTLNHYFAENLEKW